MHNDDLWLPYYPEDETRSNAYWRTGHGFQLRQAWSYPWVPVVYI